MNKALSIALFAFCGLSIYADDFVTGLKESVKFTSFRQQPWVRRIEANSKPISPDIETYGASVQYRRALKGDALGGRGPAIVASLFQHNPKLSRSAVNEYIALLTRAVEREKFAMHGLSPQQKWEKGAQVLKHAVSATGGLAAFTSSSIDGLLMGKDAAVRGRDEFRGKLALVTAHQLGFDLVSLLDPSNYDPSLYALNLKIYQEAERNPNLKNYVEGADENFRTGADGRTKIEIGESKANIKLKSPDFARDENIQALLALSGKEGLTLKELKDAYQKLIDEQVAFAKDVKLLVEEAKKRQSDEEKKQAETAHKERVALARASFGLVASLTSLIDKDTARVMGIVGSHAMDVSELIFNFATDRISSRVFATDLMGLASNVIAAIIGGPSDLEVIMKELAEVRKDIRALHEDMFKLVAGLHEHLDKITQHFDDRFDRLATDMRGGFENLQQSLDQIQNGVNLMNDKLDIGLREQRRNNTLSVLWPINEALNDTRTSQLIASLSESQVRQYLNRFATCATTSSRDPLFSGSELDLPTGMGSVNLKHAPSDTLVYGNVVGKMHPLRLIGYNINPLAEVLEWRSGVKLRPRTDGVPISLANPSLWQLCAAAYVGLSEQRRAVFESYDQGMLASIYEAGAQVQALSRTLAISPDREAVLGGIFAAHREIVVEFAKSVGEAEKAYEEDFAKFATLKNPGHYGFSGGESQALKYEPGKDISKAVGPIEVCNSLTGAVQDEWRTTKLPAVESVYRTLIPKPIQMAIQMELGTLRLCYDEIRGPSETFTKTRPYAVFSVQTPEKVVEGWASAKFGRVLVRVRGYYRHGSETKEVLAFTWRTHMPREYPYEHLGVSPIGTVLQPKKTPFAVDGLLEEVSYPREVLKDEGMIMRSDSSPVLDSVMEQDIKTLPKHSGTKFDDARTIMKTDLEGLTNRLYEDIPPVEAELARIRADINARFTLLRTAFEADFWDNEVTKGKMDPTLRALNGVKMVAERWAVTAKLPESPELTKGIGQLFDGHEIKASVGRVVSSSRAIELRTKTLGEEMLARADENQKLLSEKVLAPLNADNWNAPLARLLERIEVLSKAYSLTLLRAQK
jgi:hypothetical protein